MMAKCVLYSVGFGSVGVRVWFAENPPIPRINMVITLVKMRLLLSSTVCAIMEILAADFLSMREIERVGEKEYRGTNGTKDMRMQRRREKRDKYKYIHP